MKDQEWQYVYSHCEGCRMVDLLIGGPPLALQFLESLGRRQSHDTWTDPLWCDGGAVFDFDRRRVVFFGDSLMVEMPFRRTILAALAEVWAGYEICYAYDGTVEIGGYVGKEFALPSLDGLSAPKLAKSRNSLCHLVSVIDASGELRMWPLWWGDSKAWHGPALLDKLPGSGVRRLRLDKIPEGGVHIDVPRNVVGVWNTADVMGVFRALPELWRGWRAECWDDRYEEHLAACGDALQLPALDEADFDEALNWLRERACGMDRSYAAVPPDAVEWARFAAAYDRARPRRRKTA
ncbi:hypothetical protein EUA03_06680 [Mycolicibacterium mucogenicum]|uniref:Uncharacterized protein n=1 Tax=Mycolicibacterium mucogenicum TaxID=56689 RepID=A0A4R5WNB5_MYCMU|nr:hypothetical protein EUA03_06680 [Mycolicibacterium mucogenicum]